MKTTALFKLTACAALVLFAAGVATQTKAAGTNLVQTIGLDFVFYEQGPTNVSTNSTTVLVNQRHVSTKDLIAALGTATSNSFPANAKLVLVTDLTSTNGASAIEVQAGTNSVDVSQYFDAAYSSNSVSGTLYKNRCDWLSADFWHSALTGKVTYDLLNLTVGGPNLNTSLDVSGFAVTTSTTLTRSNAGATASSYETDAILAGTGTDTNGAPAIVQGSLTIFGHNP